MKLMPRHSTSWLASLSTTVLIGMLFVAAPQISSGWVTWKYGQPRQICLGAQRIEFSYAWRIQLLQHDRGYAATPLEMPLHGKVQGCALTAPLDVELGLQPGAYDFIEGNASFQRLKRQQAIAAARSVDGGDNHALPGGGRHR